MDKFLDGIDFYNDCPKDNLMVTDSLEYDFVRGRFPETINKVTERVHMLQSQFMATMK